MIKLNSKDEPGSRGPARIRKSAASSAWRRRLRNCCRPWWFLSCTGRSVSLRPVAGEKKNEWNIGWGTTTIQRRSSKLTAASNDPGATTRLSRTSWILVTRLSTTACSCGVGVSSWTLFRMAFENCNQIKRTNVKRWSNFKGDFKRSNKNWNWIDWENLM